MTLNKKLSIGFYVAYPYYYPHFLPISELFTKYGHEVTYILSSKQNSNNMQEIAQENQLHYTFEMQKLFSTSFDVIFFANPFEAVADVKALTIIMEHGIGTKSLSFYSAIKDFDVYLVEGTQKYNRIKELYPEHAHKLAQVGFSKLDPVVTISHEDKENLYKKYNLDSTKKTILYAPTFFPSSIEKMADTFAQEFADCNILVKPHYLSYERKKYLNHLKKFKLWEAYDNCSILSLKEYSLVPFLILADVMISDESSAMFEFAALDKPVISNRYFKLRWSYYFMPWKLSKRIDKTKDKYRQMLENASNYQETIQLTREALQHPEKLSLIRQQLIPDLCGALDGKTSLRIYDYVIEKLGK
jgi:CDP-glycerol glycerophosphotransferase (TagB/SpsB family)